MNLLHTIEEIRFFDSMDSCATELLQLSKKYQQSACADLANEYKEKVKLELDKYSHLVGKKIKGINQYYKTPFTGTIEEITHFNIYSKSVRCKVRYDAGGWDGYALKDLTLIEE